MTSQNATYVDSRYNTVYHAGRDILFVASSRIAEDWEGHERRTGAQLMRAIDVVLVQIIHLVGFDYERNTESNADTHGNDTGTVYLSVSDLRLK